MIVKTDFWLTLISSRDNNNLTISKYSFPTAIFNGVSWKKIEFWNYIKKNIFFWISLMKKIFEISLINVFICNFI